MSTPTPAEIQDYINGKVKFAGPADRDGWRKIHCPKPDNHKHGDRKPSATVNINSGHIECQACGFKGLIGKVYAELGWPAPSWSNGNGHKPTERRIVATYDYHNAAGELVYQTVRFEPKDFSARRPDGQWGVKGLKRVPYRLTEVLQAEYVYIAEGEKDCDNVHKIGLTATCNPFGAGKWTAELSQYFRPHQHITILPDNDEPGRKHAEQVAAALYGKVASVKILTLEGLPEKGDVSDWLQGKDPEAAAEELSRLSEAAPEWKPEEKGEAGSAGVYRNIAAEVREYIEGQQGSFSTTQLYNDLGIKDTADKTAARVALHRLVGTLIEADGTRVGWYRIIQNQLKKMDLSNVCVEMLDLWLPLDLHSYVSIMPGNVIVLTGGIDSGKTAFMLSVIKRNIEKWDCHYFNSEMGPEEMLLRLQKFNDFPIKHPHFSAYERSCDFADVIRTGKYVLNCIDFLEVTDEFYKVAAYLSQIHRALDGAVAIVGLQTKTGSDLPLGGQRALEKARLALSLRNGGKDNPNVATILKAKNRKTTHSMLQRQRTYHLIQGSEFRCVSPDWM